MDQLNFQTDLEQTILELTELVQQYDQEEQQSYVAQFSRYDPLKNLISALAARLRAVQGLGHDESLRDADKIVRTAEQEVNKPSVKKRICAGLKELTGDSLSLLPIILELAKAGSIAIPFDSTGVILASAACLIVTRVGISSFCSE